MLSCGLYDLQNSGSEKTVKANLTILKLLQNEHDAYSKKDKGICAKEEHICVYLSANNNTVPYQIRTIIHTLNRLSLTYITSHGTLAVL